MLMVFILLINEVNVAGVFSPSVIFFFFFVQVISLENFVISTCMFSNS